MCLAVFAAPARAARVRPAVKFLEINGSSKVKPSDFSEKHSKTIEKLMFTQVRSSTKASLEAEKLKDILVSSLKEMGDFGLVEMDLIKLDWNDSEKPVLLLFEVIEKQDMATRFPFRSVPQGEFPAIQNVLDAWSRYEEAGKKYERTLESVPDRPECPAFYCVWGSLTPELAKLEEEFLALVPPNEEMLGRAMQEDKNPKNRANSVFLLSYLRDGASVSRYMSYALMDPDASVRDAAISVLNDMTVFHPEVPIEIHVINRLLDVPYPKDRTKALALMLNLADNDSYRPFLIQTASKQILKILRTRHPNNHDMAYTVLSLLSRENIARRDYDAWDRWIWKARQESKPSASE